MSNIDDVIARSQKPGEFTERRQFTMARGRAIEKLREFALVDPHYYILELIQSAVANGATYIDIECKDKAVALRYIGGSFAETDLAQLFDFLFASQSDVEHGPLRQLALGVNALMLFEPDEIIIETGDGTLSGTTRIVVRGADEMVDVGTPEQALDGTYLRATGLNRSKIKGRSSIKPLQGEPPEYRAVENRCLTAPVPILFNDDPLFGYSRQRTPKSLIGFTNVVSFDEGDFYGTIGVARRHSGAVFRMLTHGVWIQSARHEFPAKQGGEIDNIGGIIAFDGLRKTADHSAIVEDDRYHEMWIRLRPYVNQLTSGQARNADYEIYDLSGKKFEGLELIELLRESETIVVVPKEAARRNNRSHLHYTPAANRIAESLGLPVLCADGKDRETLRMLGGRDVDFITPDLDDDRELQFYTSSEDPLPAQPWLTSPIELETSSFADITKRVAQRNQTSSSQSELPPPNDDGDEKDSKELTPRLIRKAAWLLGKSTAEADSIWDWKKEHLDPLGESIRARIYSPETRSDEQREFNIEVRAADRVVWTGYDEAVAPGQVLVITVADIAPNILWEPPKNSDEPVAQLIASSVVASHISELQTASDRGLRAALRADIEPGSNAAQLILSSLSHRVVKRIHGQNSRHRVGFSVVDPELDVEILKRPVLKTVSGDDVSLRRIEELMESCHGLLYAVRSDISADLDGLDRSRILVVDEMFERLLISLVGPTAYVRVDERDLICKFDGLQCRDIAVGLRDYPDFPLLVEGADISQWSVDQKENCLDAMLTELVAVIQEESDDDEAQELRRQAWRHLQWFCAHRGAYDFAQRVGGEVEDLPLFAMSKRRTISFSTLQTHLDVAGHVEMLDGWAVGAGELSFAEARSRKIDRGPHLKPVLLKMNPFVLHLLGEYACGTAEYHLSQQEVEALDEPDVGVDAMLERVVVDEMARGVIGVPREPVDRPAVLVFGTEERDVVLREDLGEIFGVIGKIRLREGVTHDDVESTLAKAAHDVLAHLLARVPELSAADDEKTYGRALTLLLDYAASQVQLIGRPDHTVELDVRDRLARQILSAPLFPGRDGLPIGAMALYRDFLDQADSAKARRQRLSYTPRVLADELIEPLQNWVDTYLNSEQIHRPACYTEDMALPNAEDQTGGYLPSEQCLVATLEYWLNALHPAQDGDNSPQILVRINRPSEHTGPYDDEFCQLFDRRSSPNRPILRINADHWLSRWMLAEGDQSDRPIAWAILAAYGHINNMLQQVTNEHELICQQRVADALEDGRLEMIRS